MSCKGCEIKKSIQNINVDNLIEEQLALERDIVADDIFINRIKKCEVCLFRTKDTCNKCGCFYKFRAHLKFKECPEHKW